MSEMKEMVRIVNKDEYNDFDVEISKYDPESNTLYAKYNDGTEIWEEFDKNIVHQKTPEGQEIISEYNRDDNLVHHKTFNQDGDMIDECWMEYDKSGNPIHVKRANSEFWNEFDEDGKLIRKRYSDDTESVY